MTHNTFFWPQLLGLFGQLYLFMFYACGFCLPHAFLEPIGQKMADFDGKMVAINGLNSFKDLAIQLLHLAPMRHTSFDTETNQNSVRSHSYGHKNNSKDKQ